MKTADLEKLKKIPRTLIPGRGKHGVPGMIKKHVAMLCAPIDDQWRLFSEGCLRNRYFRDQVMLKDPKCKACTRKLDDRSRLEQHHNCYLTICRYTGTPLSEGHADIHRRPREDEYPEIPDCRACHLASPENFAECLKRIDGIHAACHERVHEKERYFRNRDKENLLDQFREASGSGFGGNGSAIS